MSTNKDEKGKFKQFRWSTPMSHILLKILADEALKGNKPSSTFKHDSLVRVAREINSKFGVECGPNHVENHLKTIKKEWKIITQLKEKSDFEWDDNMKMIKVAENVYDEEISAHPQHEKFLNKKIKMYKEMSLVVGKDVAVPVQKKGKDIVVPVQKKGKDGAVGSFAKSFNNINMDEAVDLSDGDDILVTKETSSSSIASEKRSRRKRSRETKDTSIFVLASAVKEVAIAIKQLSKNQVDIDVLRKEVMKTEGFDDSTLDSAFDYLVENEKIARGFLAKNAYFRQVWIQKFVNKNGIGRF